MPIHVIPLNDDREHEFTMDCWCKPEVEWQNPETGEIHGQPLIGHNSADCREAVENLLNDGKSIAEDKDWGVFEVNG